MVSLETTITFITYFISVYVGFFIVLTGLFGNLINILVFTMLKPFQKNQSAFYLTIASIIDCSQLILSVSVRVVIAAFNFDPTRTSIIWCKLRAYLLQYGGTCSAVIICFAAIDQYLSTSYHERLKRLSTFTLAQQLVGILIITATFYSIPYAYFQEIRLILGCAIYNSVYNYIYSFGHLCIVIGVLPMFISSLFSLLAYQNVRRITRRQIPIVRRRLDRQLTAMILIRVTLFIITTLVFVSLRIYQIYSSMNQNSNTRLITIYELIRINVTIFYNVNYSGSFYMFWLSSSRFRRQVKYLLFKRIWRKCFLSLNRNRIIPECRLPTNENPASSGDMG